MSSLRATRATDVALVAAVILVACAPTVTPAGPALVAKNVTASEGAVVTAGCTPTGPEQCFNATDDNCNGVIDEGCGVGTGVLQFVVAWGDSPADVDLTVTDPNAAKVTKANRTTPSGLQLEKNCPDDGCHQQNVENVYFDGPEPVRGKYIVEVRLTDVRGAELPVKVHLSARLGARTWAMDLAMSPGPTEKQGFSFEL